MNDVVRYALGRVWQLVAAALQAWPGPGARPDVMPRAALARAFRELRLAETAARRAIFVLAAMNPVCPPPPPSGMPPEPDGARMPRRRASAATAHPRPAPRFRLSDRICGPNFGCAAIAGMDEAPAIPPAASSPVRRAAGLWRRVDALAGVLADPTPAVERVRQLRARPRRHIFSRSPAPRLRPGRPPGYVRAKWLSWEMDVVMEIHTLAMEALNRPPPGALEPPVKAP
ncbi:MAG: hypothetical protein AAGH87_06365 [Pseudomonadota bacterium]